jgi:prevent-host-death family protein
MVWQLQEAKQRFSELVRKAAQEGPQTVTRRGEEVVVVVPVEEWRRLSGEKPDFKEFLMGAPEALELIEFRRPSEDYPREADLGLEGSPP